MSCAFVVVLAGSGAGSAILAAMSLAEHPASLTVSPLICIRPCCTVTSTNTQYHRRRAHFLPIPPAPTQPDEDYLPIDPGILRRTHRQMDSAFQGLAIVTAGEYDLQEDAPRGHRPSNTQAGKPWIPKFIYATIQKNIAHTRPKPTKQTQLSSDSSFRVSNALKSSTDVYIRKRILGKFSARRRRLLLQFSPLRPPRLVMDLHLI
jgi:hypothetical protein